MNALCDSLLYIAHARLFLLRRTLNLSNMSLIQPWQSGGFLRSERSSLLL